MGIVREYEGMKKVDSNESIKLLSTEINHSFELSVSAVPISFNVYIGDDLVYACNCPGNAEKIYQIIKADVQGNEWQGN